MVLISSNATAFMPLRFRQLSGRASLRDVPCESHGIRTARTLENRAQARPTVDGRIVTYHGTVMPNAEVDASRAFSGNELGLPIWVRIWSASHLVTCLSLLPGSSLREVPCFLSRAWTVGVAWE